MIKKVTVLHFPRFVGDVGTLILSDVTFHKNFVSICHVCMSVETVRSIDRNFLIGILKR